MRQADFIFIFYLPKKQVRQIFIFISLKTNEAPFLVHLKYKNVDILILTYEKNK